MTGELDFMGGRRRVLVVAAIVLLVLPFGISLVSFGTAVGAEQTPFFERPDPKYEACVRPTLYMRYHHMDLLLELRDAGVRRGGKREISLADCRTCHPNRERFCDRCHDAVNLSPDCFECHYYPNDQEGAR
ncbi:MAG: hypothetical protein ACYTGW_09255 [Planctomycetota bacterium]|jgi:hypothetical protein